MMHQDTAGITSDVTLSDWTISDCGYNSGVTPDELALIQELTASGEQERAEAVYAAAQEHRRLDVETSRIAWDAGVGVEKTRLLGVRLDDPLADAIYRALVNTQGHYIDVEPDGYAGIATEVAVAMRVAGYSA